jgi:hypothetical protein
VCGNLYLTDKIGWSEFTGDDVAPWWRRAGGP